MLNLEAVAFPIILTVSWLAATMAVRGRARVAGLPHGLIGDLSWWAAVGALVGARLVYVGGHFPAFVAFPQDVLLTLWHGLSFYGGLVGAMLLGYAYTRRRGLSVWTLAKVVAPALPLGIALARLGFVGQEAWALRSSGGGMPIGGTANLLEAMICFGMFVSTSNPARRGAPSPFLLVLIGYGLVRALVDMLRPEASGSWLQGDQALSLALALACAAILLVMRASRYRMERVGGTEALRSSEGAKKQ